jgi:hypothetical protein
MGTSFAVSDTNFGHMARDSEAIIDKHRDKRS